MVLLLHCLSSAPRVEYVFATRVLISPSLSKLYVWLLPRFVNLWIPHSLWYFLPPLCSVHCSTSKYHRLRFINFDGSSIFFTSSFNIFNIHNALSNTCRRLILGPNS